MREASALSARQAMPPLYGLPERRNAANPLPQAEAPDGKSTCDPHADHFVAAVSLAISVPDPFAYVVSLNVKRRNLTAGQFAIAAAEA